MNINLATNYPIDDDGNAESFQSQIEEHQDILRNAGYAIVGPAVLIPEPGAEYPGSYQVWSPVGFTKWVFVDADGVIHTVYNQSVLGGWT